MKKKIFSISTSLMLGLFVSLGWQASAQCPQNTTFQPAAGAGDEVVILSSDGCIPAGSPSPYETRNWYGLSDLEMTEWTINGLGCNLLHGKTLIRFDQMNTLPANAVITYAELRLNGIPTSLQNTLGNTWYPGTPFLDNAGTVYLVDGGAPGNWTKNGALGVTWNTAPLTLPAPNAAIPVTTTQWNNNFAINVTTMTQQIWANMNSSLANNGYLLQLNLTNYYRNTMWASSFNIHGIPGPSLYVEYYVCDAGFDYCSSTSGPNTYTFTAANPSSCYNYVWSYGDGSPNGSGTSSTHTYTATGSYTVCLMLEDNLGNVKCQECTTICVNQIAPHHRPANTHANTNNPATAPAAPAKIENVPVLAMDNSINIRSISPNPTNSDITVNLSILKGGKVHYNIYDMQGKVVLQGDNTMGTGTEKFSVNVNRLAPGNYLLELLDSYSTSAKAKFTKE